MNGLLQFFFIVLLLTFIIVEIFAKKPVAEMMPLKFGVILLLIVGAIDITNFL